MLRTKCILLTGLALSFSASAANKEHEAIQRDISLLSDDVRKMQKSVDDQLIALKTMVQQVINSSSQTNTGLVAFEVKMIERMQNLEKSVNTATTNLGARVDTMADEFRRIREDVGDVNGRLKRMQDKMADLETLVKEIKRPTEPPPVPVTAPTPVAAPPAGPPPGTTAEGLFQNATRDKIGGRYELAISGFQDYLKWFPDTDNACVAQYNIGDIHFVKSDYVNALVAFDVVLEKYPTNCSHRPNAMFMRARSFEKADQPTAAAKEYRKLKADFPGSEWDRKATAALRSLGFSATAPQPKKRR